ncbi:MAG: phosphate transport system regulatory protein PhoU [Phycisphaerae bacterium]|nr:phosphate transport system regulatory protein PhoU [Phycisphaerae bacterium]OUX01080.1 MAG: phosphate transport system regulatory protein PhoU [Phycisphaeraceae bacterium TMED231]
MPVDLESNLTRLRRELLALGAKVDQRVYGITASILDADVEAARTIKKGDEEIDQDDLSIEEQCIRLLALAAPVATDLRELLAIMRISGEFERIADLCKGMSKRVIRVSSMPAVRLPDPLAEMCMTVRDVFAKALRAVADADVELARQVNKDDDELDRLHKAMLIWAREEIPRDPESTNAAIELLAIAQRLERTGDIAVSIAGNLIYLVEGRVVRHGNL